MTHALRFVPIAAALAFLSPRASLESPPEKGTVTEIRIGKSAHTLELLAGSDVVRSYTVAIGSGGSGPKRFEGDKVTPVGKYHVTGRIKGLFHEFLIVSYPNADDVRRYGDLKRRGEVPAGAGVGNGIGIHGSGASLSPGEKPVDWTYGCVALDDQQIDEVASLVRDGTTIVIND